MATGPGDGGGGPVAARWSAAIDRLYVALAVVSVLMVPAVWVVARGAAPLDVAVGGLLVEAVVFRGLATVDRTLAGGRWSALVLHALVGVGTTALGLFFGPHSGLAGFLSALIVVLGGSASDGTARRNGWAAYLSIATGQAVLVGLIVAGVITDRAMLPLVSPDLAGWQVVALQVAVQVVYLGAFATGGSVARRYRALVSATEIATRDAIGREALVAEARAEHQRALHAGGYGVFAGQRVGGYLLRGMIGRGGMGEVYDAVDGDGRAVAVKVLRGDRLGDADALARMRREAAALRRVDSPYVARLYAAGGAEHELPFVAMERCDGDTLDALARPGHGLDAAALGQLVDHATRALEAVHAVGLVHRDVSPANLIRTPRAGLAGGPSASDPVRWKLLDFGISVPPDRLGSQASVGTLRYVAPEQLRGETVDGRADLYGLGLCLFLAATGRVPFPHPTRDGLIAAVLHQMPVAPSMLAPVPAELDDVLLIAIAKDPRDRFATPAELRVALAAALRGERSESLRARAARLAVRHPWSTPAASGIRNHDEEVTVVDGLGAATVTRAGESPEPVPWSDNQPTSSLESPASPSPRATGSHPAIEVNPWDHAYVAKMEQGGLMLLGMCGIGAVFLALIAVRREPLWIALACMAAVTAIVGANLRAARRGGMAGAHRWSWALVPPLAAGPTYFFGATSAFSAVIGAFLFQSGLFQRGLDSGATSARRRGLSWFELRFVVGTVAAQTAIHALVMLGVIPDAGLYPVRIPGAPEWELWMSMAALDVTYLAVTFAAWRIDHQFQRLIRAADIAARAAARAQSLLETARRELRRALGHAGPGLFTGHVIGRYRLGALVGRGGMGEVYDAVQTSTHQRAAVKLLRADRLGDRPTLDRFLREAAALSRLDSDYVARVYEVGGLDGELPHIAMEFLDGNDLAALLHNGGSLSRSEVAALVADVTRGLAAAHRAEVVHRDIKPRNLVRVTTAAGTIWKLVDFGVAKLVDHGAHTTGHLILGTPAYMSPEQAAGHPVDARTDLFALGLVIYRVTVGRPAASGDVGRGYQEPLDPRISAGVSDELEVVLRIALAPDPSDRFASAEEMGAAFAAAWAGELTPAMRARAARLRDRHPWRTA